MRDSDLSLIDRFTLKTWRGANVAGWTLLAFVAAVALHVWLTVWLNSRAGLVSGQLLDLNVRAGGEEGFDDWVAKFGLRIALSVVLGLVIGTIVGRRVWRRQALFAALAGLGYTLYIALTLEQNTATQRNNFIARTTWVSGIAWELVVVGTAVVAALWARRIARRRPLHPTAALSPGSPPRPRPIARS